MGIVFCGLVGFLSCLSFFLVLVTWWDPLVYLWDPLGTLLMNLFAFTHKKKCLFSCISQFYSLQVFMWNIYIYIFD